MLNKLKLLKLSVQVAQQTMPFYAVAAGRRTGIFEKWAECEAQIKNFKSCRYKKFKSRTEAEMFLRSYGVNVSNSNHNLERVNQSAAKPKTVPQEAPPDIRPEYFEEDGDFDELLLETCAEKDPAVVAKLPTGYKCPSPEPVKRKNDSYHLDSFKRSKLSSIVWEAVGEKKYGKFMFPIDSEGYVICYTDGSCENNGQANPAAGFGVYFSEGHQLNTSKPVTGRATNNCGEIQAAIYAIKLAKDIGIPNICISTDSQFLINAITEWVPNWKKRNWKLKSGGPVKNIVDFKELDEILQDKKINVKWNYVKGHKNIIGNERADELAKQGANMYKYLHNKK